MSYELSPQRRSIAFDMPSGNRIDEQPDGYDCVLDIHSNVVMDLGAMGLGTYGHQGNYSGWVSLADNEGVAVTGLTSCGAVLVANPDFSRVAAGHMSGDACFVKDWCAALTTGRNAVQPAYMLWGTGPTGSRSTGGQMLMQYMKAFGLNPAHAPAVAACGAIFLVRSGRGKAFAHHDVRIAFRPQGQAVRTPREPSALRDALMRFTTLQDFDVSDDMANFAMLMTSLGGYVNERVALEMDPDAAHAMILARGPALMRRFVPLLADLPESYQQAFRDFNLFRKYPSLRV